MHFFIFTQSTYYGNNLIALVSGEHAQRGVLVVCARVDDSCGRSLLDQYLCTILSSCQSWMIKSAVMVSQLGQLNYRFHWKGQVRGSLKIKVEEIRRKTRRQSWVIVHWKSMRWVRERTWWSGVQNNRQTQNCRQNIRSTLQIEAMQKSNKDCN